MLQKLFLSVGLFFLVTSMSYAGNTSSYVDFELGGFGLQTMCDRNYLDGKIGEGLSAGLWIGVAGGLRIGGDFEYSFIKLDEKIVPGFQLRIDKVKEKQASAGLSLSFLNFESSALYLKATVGLWNDTELTVKDNDVGLNPEDIKPKIKQPNLYGGIGWFFSNTKGSVLKNVGTRIEVGYQTQKVEDEDDGDFDLNSIRVKGTLVYSIR